MQLFKRSAIWFIIAVGIGAAVFSLIPTKQTLRPLVRLHIIANSDSVSDQAVKYEIRDAVVAYLSPKLKDVTELSEARKIVAAEQANLENITMGKLKEKNKKYSVMSRYGYYYFPPRTYGAIFVPEGKYEALRIVLGGGEGRNWWCVLFPPLCFTKGTGWNVGSKVNTVNTVNTANTEKVKPVVQVKSKIWEVLQ